jgi:hypothetical protein
VDHEIAAIQRVCVCHCLLLVIPRTCVKLEFPVIFIVP